jgi:gamma-glutamylcyclotransferase (GGCT)/AIG2-like uncharacterized protein YtfP
MSAKVTRVPREGLSLVDRLKVRSRWTPDFHHLRKFPEIPVLIYDQLRRGGDDHDLLKGANYHGLGHTAIGYFSLGKHHNNVVAFREDEHCMFKGHIRGEVYTVSVEHIHVLDRTYMNLKRYSRLPVRVQLENITPKGAFIFRDLASVQCILYVGKEDYWSKGEKIKGYVPIINSLHHPILKNVDYSEFNPINLLAQKFGRNANSDKPLITFKPVQTLEEVNRERLRQAFETFDDAGLFKISPYGDKEADEYYYMSKGMIDHGDFDDEDETLRIGPRKDYPNFRM